MIEPDKFGERRTYLASIKKLTDRKFKITISNGYHPSGKKICKAKTITVPDSVKPRVSPSTLLTKPRSWNAW